MRWIYLMIALLGFAHAAHAEPLLNSTWQTGDGSARIKIVACRGGTPCGKIVWVNPNSPSRVDQKNPNPSLRGRRLVGVTILWGFTKSDDRWTNGKIYNPKNGKTYKSHFSLQPNGVLKVQGCVGPFCQSQRWTRVR